MKLEVDFAVFVLVDVEVDRHHGFAGENDLFDSHRFEFGAEFATPRRPHGGGAIVRACLERRVTVEESPQTSHQWRARHDAEIHDERGACGISVIDIVVFQDFEATGCPAKDVFEVFTGDGFRSHGVSTEVDVIAGKAEVFGLFGCLVIRQL